MSAFSKISAWFTPLRPDRAELGEFGHAFSLDNPESRTRYLADAEATGDPVEVADAVGIIAWSEVLHTKE